MEARSLKYIAESCGGHLRRGRPDSLVKRVNTDSRQTQVRDLFVALAGEKFDGHNFLGEVAKSGATAVLIQKERVASAPPEAAIITVDDTRQALGRLAGNYREGFEVAMVAVAGSNGKTTTKDLLAAVLAQRGQTLKSEASFNNDIGVPLTLLKLEVRHVAAVLEVGTNHPGELAPLVRLIQPRYGVITSIGREHLEFFGDLAGVAEEEGWLAQLLPPDGVLFVDGDSPELDRILGRTRARVVKVGWADGCDWQATRSRLSERGTTFAVTAPDAGFSGEYALQLLGRHQVTNALLALAVGAELGLGREELRRALAECPPPKMRLNVKHRNGVCVLDDTYNANADSMTAALQTLRDFPCAGRRVAVLGDMGELGAQSQSAHVEVGALAAQSGLSELLTVGSMSAVMGTAARSAGLAKVTEFSSVEKAVAEIKAHVRADDVVLIKASRAARLERVIEAI